VGRGHVPCVKAGVEKKELTTPRIWKGKSHIFIHQQQWYASKSLLYERVAKKIKEEKEFNYSTQGGGQ